MRERETEREKWIYFEPKIERGSGRMEGEYNVREKLRPQTDS